MPGKQRERNRRNLFFIMSADRNIFFTKHVLCFSYSPHLVGIWLFGSMVDMAFILTKLLNFLPYLSSIYLLSLAHCKEMDLMHIVSHVTPEVYSCDFYSIQLFIKKGHQKTTFSDTNTKTTPNPRLINLSK